MQQEIKRNCMTMIQGHKLITYIESLAEDGKIKMTARKIASSSEQAIGMLPSKQSVQKFCRELEITYEYESRSGANGRGKSRDRMTALEVENIKLMEAGEALEVRVRKLEEYVITQV